MIVELRALGVELRALDRAFAIIVLNDLNACFLGFLADFFTLLYKIYYNSTLHAHLAHFFWGLLSEIYSRALLVSLLR